MITNYHRPQSLQEALKLLARADVKTLPMGGGTYLSRHSPEACEVVDLQSLGLDGMVLDGHGFCIGATTQLQKLVELDGIPEEIKTAVAHEASYNLRQVATIAGTLVCSSGRSLLATVLLALDVRLLWEPGGNEVAIGDWLPLRHEWKKGLLITHIVIPAGVKVRYEMVSRTPQDQPIVCAAISRWCSGRVRVALGGYGEQPVLAVDGPGVDGAEIAARSAYSHAEDQWASAEYRREMAGVMVMRLASSLMDKG